MSDRIMTAPDAAGGWRITGYKGSTTVRSGDRFKFSGEPEEWEIVMPTGEVTYSPSGIGGCAVLSCRLVSGAMPKRYAQYATNGVVEFCGDSIASAILAQALDPVPGSARNG